MVNANHASSNRPLVVKKMRHFFPGPIPWFITAELFSQAPRPAAVAVAGVVNWLSNFVIGLVFPSMQVKIWSFFLMSAYIFPSLPRRLPYTPYSTCLLFCCHLLNHLARTVVSILRNVVCFLFPQNALYPYTFVVFIVLVGIFFAFTLFFVPETKGKTIQEISSRFSRKKQTPSNKARDMDPFIEEWTTGNFCYEQLTMHILCEEELLILRDQKVQGK